MFGMAITCVIHFPVQLQHTDKLHVQQMLNKNKNLQLHEMCTSEMNSSMNENTLACPAFVMCIYRLLSTIKIISNC